MPSLQVVLILLPAGFLAGVAQGLYGIGGGILTVPLLVLSAERLDLGSDHRLFVAASLLAIALSGPMSLRVHHRAGHVHWRTGLWLAGGGLAGLALETQVDRYVNPHAFFIGFACLLAVSSYRLLHRAHGGLPLPGPLGLALAGVGAGFLAKLFGIGGGILMVPVLAFLGFSMHRAVATSLVAVFTNAFVGTAWNLAVAGPGDWVVWGLTLGIGAQVGAWIGSGWALRTGAGDLRGGFSLLLLAISIEFVRRAFA